MQFLIIEKYHFREQYRLFMACFSLTAFSYLQHSHGSHFRKTAGSCTCSHGDKGIIAAAGGNRIKLIFPTLEALFHVSLHISQGNLFYFFFRQFQLSVFFQIFCIRFLCIRRQDIFYTWHCKTAVLLTGCA